jgi:hypothetical protein
MAPISSQTGLVGVKEEANKKRKHLPVLADDVLAAVEDGASLSKLLFY